MSVWCASWAAQGGSARAGHECTGSCSASLRNAFFRNAGLSLGILRRDLACSADVRRAPDMTGSLRVCTRPLGGSLCGCCCCSSHMGFVCCILARVEAGMATEVARVKSVEWACEKNPRCGPSTTTVGLAVDLLVVPFLHCVCVCCCCLAPAIADLRSAPPAVVPPPPPPPLRTRCVAIVSEDNERGCIPAAARRRVYLRPRVACVEEDVKRVSAHKLWLMMRRVPSSLLGDFYMSNN